MAGACENNTMSDYLNMNVLSDGLTPADSGRLFACDSERLPW